MDTALPPAITTMSAAPFQGSDGLQVVPAGPSGSTDVAVHLRPSSIFKDRVFEIEPGPRRHTLACLVNRHGGEVFVEGPKKVRPGNVIRSVKL